MRRIALPRHASPDPCARFQIAYEPLDKASLFARHAVAVTQVVNPLKEPVQMKKRAGRPAGRSMARTALV